MTEQDFTNQTPLEIDIPDDPIQQVHRYARDLAWGAVQGFWAPRAIIEGNRLEFTRREHQKNYAVYMLKWGRLEPSIHMLTAFGYMTTHMEGSHTAGLLTREAFALLSKPVDELKVFISYRRQDSTAFALLVEARLRLAGNHAVFVDKLLEVGGEWRSELENRIRESKYFILLVGPTTFDSDWVRREIDIAAEAGCIIVPIWQADVLRDERTPEVVNARQEIRVERETAESYETAILKLLNRMGYATY